MKQLLTLILVLGAVSARAQVIDDVLRYSTENLQGTARFQAMSGAFGALGGDIAALNVNPAGAAVFNSSQFTVTTSNYNAKNQSFLGTTSQTETNNSFKINQLGGALVFNTTADSPWKKFTLAFSYNQAQNFDNKVFASGSTPQSMDSYFLFFAQGQPYGDLKSGPGESIADAYLDIGAYPGFAAQQAFLGLQAGIITPLNENDDTNTVYRSALDANPAYQQYQESTSGYNSKFTVNFAGQYQENFYLGASLNFHTVLYDRLTLLDEEGDAYTAYFDNSLHTEGSGFSLGLGGIARLTDNLRVGLSYQSPTWYRLKDDLAQRIRSSLSEDPSRELVDFGLVTLFEDYRIKIPSKFTASTAVVFGKKGLLSVDYSYQNMAHAALRPATDPDFAVENDFIAKQLGVVNTVRVGGEWRWNAVSLRAGYRFEESPYKDTGFMGHLNSFSTGVGYRFGGSRLDLAFSRSKQEVTAFFFDSGIDNASVVDKINTTLGLSYTLTF